MTIRNPTGSNPGIFKYSLIFLASYLAVALPFGFLLEHLEAERTVIVSAVVAMIAGSFVSWLFVKKNHRHLTKKEFWKLVSYSFLWMLPFELAGLVVFLFYPEELGWEGPSDMKFFYMTAAITLLLDYSFAYFAYRFSGRRVIQKYLEKHIERPV